MMSEEEKKRLKDSFARLFVADELLKKTTELLAEFGTDVPSLNAGALQMMCETVNSVDKSMDFIRSFIRVSTLQQVAKEGGER